MKFKINKISILLIASLVINLITNKLFAQNVASGIYFQAVARDNFANPAKDRKIYVQSSILQKTANGPSVLTEIHETTTDATGVFGISIGLGNRVGGTASDLSTVPWSKGPFFLNLKISITPSAPVTNWDYTKDWVDLGTTPFGTVPYALYSETTGGLDAKLNVTDTSKMLALYAKAQTVQSLSTALATKISTNDTSAMLAPYKAAVNALVASNITSLTASAINAALDSKLNIADSITQYVTPAQLAAKTFDSTAIYNQLGLKANKTYVDAQIAGATIADADVNTKGKLQLAGDLTGTAASPTIANNAITSNKIADGAIVNSKIASGIDGSKINGNISGNAATATKIAIPVTINGVAFDGSSNITISSAAANALTMNNSGAGDVSGTIFDGSSAKTISYNTIGASPLAGSGSLTTVGTITTGVWSGTAIDVTKGGTGATNAADARTNLGLTIGTDVMAANAITTLTGDVAGSGNGNFVTTVNSVGGVNSSTIATLPSSVNTNTASITAETTRAINAESGLDTRIASNTNSITSNIASIGTLNTNVSANTASITTLNNNVSTNAADILLRAPLASPAFTGVPTAPTPATNDNSTTLATTAYVKASITAANAGVSSVGPISGTSNANGGTISGSTQLILTPADANFGGVVTTATQTFAGSKTFTNTVTFGTDITVNGIKIGKGGGNNLANTAIGSGALALNTSGSGSTAFGYNTLSKSTGGNATAFGTAALENLTTGTANVAVGYTALNQTSTQNSNTAVGDQAMRMSTGANNTALGASALYGVAGQTNGNNNTAIGNFALKNATTAAFNVGVGSNSLNNITSGNDNTVFGYQSGYLFGAGTGANLTSMSQGVLIGSNVRAGTNTSTNEIAIGYNVVGNGSNTVTIGNYSNTANYFRGDINLTGNVNGGTWSGTVIGSNYGGAGTVNGLMKANGSGVVSAALAGTDYQSPLTAGSGISINAGTISATGLTTSNLASNAAITNSQLANSSTTLGSTAMTLGGTVTSVTGLSSVSSTNFTGALTGNVTGNVTGDVTGNLFGNANTATTAGNITATSNTTLTSLTSLNTVGTITSGTWSASVIDIAHGGTGSSTIIGAKTNLGLNNVENTALSTWTGSTNLTNVGSLTAIGKTFMFQDVILGYGNANGAKIQTDASNKYISFYPNYNIESTRMWPSGNVTIQNGGTFTDNGYNLEVAGTTKFVGNSSITGDLNVTGNITGATWSGTAITNNKLANSALTIGSTNITLGATTSSLAGLSTVTSTNFIGALTGNASTATALATGRTISTTGDVTYTSGSFDGSSDVTGVATLAASGVASGTYGSSTAIPVLTVDTKGRVTSASTVGIIAGVNSLNYTSTTSYANGGTISGTSLTLAAADATNPGLISIGVQTIAGAKTFNNDLTAPNFLGNATTATTAGNITATSNTTLTSLANLATVGTITAGTWSATEIAIAKGGTGATTASGARTNLGLGSIATKSTIADADVDASAAIAFSKLNITKSNITGLGIQESLTAGSGISISAGTISATGLTTSNLASNAAIANAQLANSTTTLGSTTMTLGGTVTSVTGLTSVSSSGFIGALTGNASTATKLASTKNINGVPFDGSADVTITANSNTLTGTILASNVVSSSLTGVATITSGVWSGTVIGSNVGGAGTVSGIMKANGSGVVSAAVAGTDYQVPYSNLTNIGSLSNSTGYLKNVGTGTFTYVGSITDADLSTITTAGKVSNTATTATSANTANAIVARDASGNFTAGTITGSLSGTASTANALTTGRTISTTGDVTYTSGSFDGTGNITGVATLAASGVSSGTYGSSTTIPILTIDTKGRVTTVSTVSIVAGINTITAIAGTSNSNGATISGTVLTLTPADATNGGIVTNGMQTFAGAKTFSGTTTFNTDIVVDGINIGTGANNSGTTNTAIGVNALNGSGVLTDNVAVGYQTLYTGLNAAGYNTAVGSTAGRSITTGNDNSFFGYRAGYNTTTGFRNTVLGSKAMFGGTNIGSSNEAVGYMSLYSNTSGYGNSAMGDSALFLNTTGYYNVGIGHQAISSNTTGTNNIGLGYISLASNTSGSQNIGIGRATLYNNGAGINNIAIGFEALSFNGLSGTYSNNIAIGKGAGKYYASYNQPANNLADNIFIGVDAWPLNSSDANSIVIGNSTATNVGAVGLGSNSTSIGNTLTQQSRIYGVLTTVPSTASAGAGYASKIEAQGSSSTVGAGGSVTLKAGDNSSSGNGGSIYLTPGTSSSGTAGKVIASSDMTVNGISVGKGLASVSSNTAVGVSALAANTTGTHNSGIGNTALTVNTTGSYNTGLGSTALAAVTIGSNNTAIGYKALNANVTSDQNTALGSSALQNNTAANNTAVGANVLSGNLTGTLNAGLGLNAMFNNTSGSNNSALGAIALYSNTTGSDNIAFGQRAGTAATGSQNVFLGSNAGISNTSVSNNILIGYGAGQYYGTLSNTNYTTGGGNVLIGNDVRPLADGQSNQIVIAGYTGSGVGMTGNGSNTVTIGNAANTANYFRGVTNVNTGTLTATTGFNLTGSVNDFLEYNVQNTSTGTSAQSGYNAMANNGTDAVNFAWMGINNSTFNSPQTYNIGGVNDVSFMGAGNDMYIANSNNYKSIIFSTGTGSTPFFNEKMRLTNSGTLAIGTTGATAVDTTNAKLHVAGKVKILDGNQGAGKVLTSDANGLASWSNSIGSTVVTSTTTYAITLAEAFVFYTGTAAGTFSIPAAASSNAGKEITIKNKTAFGITITPASGTIFIDSVNTGAANVSIGIEASNNWIKLVSDGTQWNVLRALF